MLLLLLLSAAPGAAHAAGYRFQIGDRSDDVLRVELRLSDLGYLTAVPNGRWEQADADALAAFAAANGVTVYSAGDRLFLAEALSAPAIVSAVSEQTSLITYGTLMPWEDVLKLISEENAYDVTSCYSGITLHMVCTLVASHAKMRPELDWDEATLRGFFFTGSSAEKQPVVITVDGVLIAASIQQAAPGADESILPEYALYFSGSRSGINGIPDAEHESIVHIAANQP